MNPIESLTIDDVPIRITEFAVPEMSLSSSRSTMTKHSFTVTYSATALIEQISSAYALWVDESKADDRLRGEPQDELALAGYPSLAQLLKMPSLAELVIGNYLLQESLGIHTGDGNRPINYWFDQVTKCEVDGNKVRLLGICYSRMS
jgi:hypothetical protein